MEEFRSEKHQLMLDGEAVADCCGGSSWFGLPAGTIAYLKCKIDISLRTKNIALNCLGEVYSEVIKNENSNI